MGNYRHNIKVLSSGKGELIIARRSSKINAAEPTDYLVLALWKKHLDGCVSIIESEYDWPRCVRISEENHRGYYL